MSKLQLCRNDYEKIILIRLSEFLKEYPLSECHFQRILNETRALKIYEHLKSIVISKQEPILASIITLCRIDKEYFFLIDGNHRIFAYKKLYEKNGYDLLFYLCVVDVANESEANDIFKFINKNSKLEKIPEGIPYSKVNLVKDHFFKKYPKIFKTSFNPHRPNISETAFGDVICRIIESDEIIEHGKIIEKIEDYNKFLSKKTENHFKDKFDDEKKVRAFMAKAKESKFYIGALGDNWRNEILNIFGAVKATIFKRKKFTLKERIAVWNKYIGSDVKASKCFFCENSISLDKFEVAHDTSIAKGGSNDIKNLFPLCGFCNKLMSTKSFEEVYFPWREQNK